MSRKPTDTIDYTSRDYEAFRELLIDKLQELMPEYTDTSQTDAGIAIIEGIANGLDILSLYLDTLANDLILTTTQDRRIATLIARILGYSPYNQTTSLTKQVFVLNETKDTAVIIPKGTQVTTVSDLEDVDPMIFETVENLTIPAGALGDETDEETGEYLYTVDVAQGETIEDEVLGTSDGSPYQTFKLAYENVLVDTIEVTVEEENSIEVWTRVSSFINSEINNLSKVYTVNVDDYDVCTIEFGNGVKGKIPAIIDGGISVTYRVGGGTASNVAANTIVELESDIESVENTFNPYATYYLGHDMETLEEIKVNAPANFSTRNRAVTLEDYEYLFQVNNEGEFYGIWRVQAINDENVNTKVHLYVQMRSSEYELTEDLIEQMGEFLDSRIMLGTSYTIQEHTSTAVNISANLVVDNDYVQSEVQSLVEACIKSFFSGVNFTFDDTFINSELEQYVMKGVDGIIAFRITSPSEDILSPNSEESILALGTVTLTVSGGTVNE